MQEVMLEHFALKWRLEKKKSQYGYLYKFKMIVQGIHDQKQLRLKVVFFEIVVI